MGNCFHRCFGIVDRKRRRYVQGKYDEDHAFSIEFETLMEEEPGRDEMTRLLTDRERELLNGKQFDALASEQRKADEELDAKLAGTEEELAREEEAFYEAKREAARIAKLKREKELAQATAAQDAQAWQPDWNGAGGVEDDFETFLANVKARSLATRSQVKNGSADGHSSNSSPAGTRGDRTENSSSLDMEWDHEAGMSPHRRPNPATHRPSIESESKQSASPLHSSDLEWDPEFVSADDSDISQLVNGSTPSKQRLVLQKAGR